MMVEGLVNMGEDAAMTGGVLDEENEVQRP